MSENIHDDLIFVGYTNGFQILYATERDSDASGQFYGNTEGECIIPLYMLKTHWHRIQGSTNGSVTMEDIKKAQLQEQNQC